MFSLYLKWPSVASGRLWRNIYRGGGFRRRLDVGQRTVAAPREKKGPVFDLELQHQELDSKLVPGERRNPRLRVENLREEAPVSKMTFNNKDYEVDEYGYLAPPEQWDEDFALGMAKALKIDSGLIESHWRIIRYLRKKFIEENSVPLVAQACLDNDIDLLELRVLFPTGYHRGACKIAGINYRYLPPPPTPRLPAYKLDEIGFLADSRDWDLDFVEHMMKELGGGSPTERHLDVIRYLRDYYERHQDIPTVYEACAANNLSHKELLALFPDGYRRGACRLAGLPSFG